MDAVVGETYKTVKLTVALLIIALLALYLAFCFFLDPKGLIRPFLLGWFKYLFASIEATLVLSWIAIRQDERSSFKVCGACGSRH